MSVYPVTKDTDEVKGLDSDKRRIYENISEG